MQKRILHEFKAGLFQALAHPTRIAIVDILREGESSAGAILECLGLEQANVSQHLAVLRAKEIVSSRKEGNQVFYSLKHKMLVEVLDVMRQYFMNHLTEAAELLQALQAEESAATKGTK